MIFDLTGRTALVTGGSRGIGRAACVGFARAGADVAVNYRSDPEPAEATADQVRALGRRATTVRADVTSEAEVERMMAEVAEFVGAEGLHVLYNNAGENSAGSLETLSVDEWDAAFALNARGPFLCVRAALPLLKAAADARIINIGTAMMYRGTPGLLHYISAKSALIGFTHALARELAPYGVTVNCIVPSMVQTETAERKFAGAEVAVIPEQAIQRYQQPEDLVGLLVFLASPASGFTTGQTILADGGRILL